MGLFAFIFSHSRKQAWLRQLAARIAAASVDEVCRRVQPAVSDMSPAEARGYIRARAAAVVNARIGTALHTQSELASGERHQLIEMVTAKLIPAVLNAADRPAARRVTSIAA